MHAHMHTYTKYDAHTYIYTFTHVLPLLGLLTLVLLSTIPSLIRKSERKTTCLEDERVKQTDRQTDKQIRTKIHLVRNKFESTVLEKNSLVRTPINLMINFPFPTNDTFLPRNNSIKLFSFRMSQRIKDSCYIFPCDEFALFLFLFFLLLDRLS